MSSSIQVSASIQPGDIVFECPTCGKSLAIDPRGAGLIITCPDCKNEVQVPSVVDEADETDEVQGGDPVAARLETLRKALERIEKNHALDAQRFEAIRAEVALLQASLDRIVGILGDAVGPSGTRS